MMISGSGAINLFPKHMTAAIKDQVAVQNTWYTVLPTTLDAEIYGISTMMATADETIDVRVTIDGVVLQHVSGGSVHTFGTDYYWYPLVNWGGQNTLQTATTAPIFASYYLKGRSVKVEMRKTSANGANHLYGVVHYRKL